MSDKIKQFDRISPKVDLSKFDISGLSNDGGKYSPSIRRLRQQYFHDSKSLPKQILSSSIPTPSNDFIQNSLKCDDCREHDGLFQCYHCHQRLCIRCCNKHYKKVTNELEYLNELSDHLLTKIFYNKIDFEKQKNHILEQSHQWRIDIINKINHAHALIIQTIQDEYEILSKEYERFVDEEMSNINSIKNELFQMKKGNLGSLLSPPTNRNFKTSLDVIRERIESFVERIDQKGKFTFQVKLPELNLDENLRVESSFGDMVRSISALQTSTDEFSTDSSSDNAETTTDSTVNPCPSISRRHTLPCHRTSEIDGVCQRRRISPSPIQSLSYISSNEYPSTNQRTKSTSSS